MSNIQTTDLPSADLVKATGETEPSRQIVTIFWIFDSPEHVLNGKVHRCLSYLYSRVNEVTFMSYKPCAVSRRVAIGLTWSTELYEAQMLSFPQLHNAATKMVFAPPFYCHSLRNLNDGDHRHRHVHQGILLLQSHQAWNIEYRLGIHVVCLSPTKTTPHHAHLLQEANNNCSIRQLDKWRVHGCF